MDVFFILLSLGFLIFMAYKGYSVILIAPIAALIAVLFIDPLNILPYYTGIFLPKMVEFIANYFPVFLLSAIFGKLIELSGIAEIIAKAIIRWIGKKQVILTIVLLTAVLTYSGISVFVVVFAVYPFAKQLFIQADIPKRLMPAVISLGAATFTMDALPGTPQIQNIIPTNFFGTDIYAAPILGIIGASIILAAGLLFLEWRKRTAQNAGEGFYGLSDETAAALEEYEINESQSVANIESKDSGFRIFFAFLPLALVFVCNMFFTKTIPSWYPNGFDFAAFGLEGYSVNIEGKVATWAVMLGIIVGIIAVVFFDFKRIKAGIKEGITKGVSGSLLAVMNTGSEYGFGSIISVLPGFPVIANGISGVFSNPLLNGAVTTNVLAGVTGSASGGMSIALGVMGNQYNQMIQAFNIPPEVMHRVIAMASGGMDSLPHNGGVITVLTVTGLTHKQAYGDIFAILLIKTMTVFIIIAIYTIFGIY